MSRLRAFFGARMGSRNLYVAHAHRVDFIALAMSRSLLLTVRSAETSGLVTKGWPKDFVRKV
jgi:hypothetical protein